MITITKKTDKELDIVCNACGKKDYFETNMLKIHHSSSTFAQTNTLSICNDCLDELKNKINLEVSKELHRQLINFAKQEGISLESAVNLLLYEALGKN